MRHTLKNTGKRVVCVLGAVLLALQIFPTTVPVFAEPETEQETVASVEVETDVTATQDPTIDPTTLIPEVSTTAEESADEDEPPASPEITVESTEEPTGAEDNLPPQEEPSMDPAELYANASVYPWQLHDIDFTSCSILVGTEDESIFVDWTPVRSSYEHVYLLQFDDPQTAMLAYAYYMDKADFIESNTDIYAADTDNADPEEQAETGTAQEETVNNTPSETDPFTEVQTILEEDRQIREQAEKSGEEVPQPVYDIALIDSGVGTLIQEADPEQGLERIIDIPEGVDAVSVIGNDTFDDNGHGNDMLADIREQNPEAKVLSIKALDADGRGDVSAVYAAIQYAIEKGVKIINLSMAARIAKDSHVVEEAVRKAVDQGIIVVGAAGNNSQNVNYFIPGRIEEALIVGACNIGGVRQEFSNYGDTVDYNVVADSTSDAAAKMSGWLSAHSMEDIEGILNQGLIFAPVAETTEPEEEPVETELPEYSVFEAAKVGRPFYYANKNATYSLPTSSNTNEDVNTYRNQNSGITKYGVRYNKSTYTLNTSDSLPTVENFFAQSNLNDKEHIIQVPLVDISNEDDPDAEAHRIKTGVKEGTLRNSIKLGNGTVYKSSRDEVVDVRGDTVWFLPIQKGTNKYGGKKTSWTDTTYYVYDQNTKYGYLFKLLDASAYYFGNGGYTTLLIRKKDGAMRIGQPYVVLARDSDGNITSKHAVNGSSSTYKDYTEDTAGITYNDMIDWSSTGVPYYLNSSNEILPQVRVNFRASVVTGKEPKAGTSLNVDYFNLKSSYTNLYIGYKDIDDYGALRNKEEAADVSQMFRSSNPAGWDYTAPNTPYSTSEPDTTYVTVLPLDYADDPEARGTTVWGLGHNFAHDLDNSRFAGRIYQETTKLKVQSVDFTMYSSTNQANAFELATIGYPVTYRMATDDGSNQRGYIKDGKDYEEVIAGFSPALRKWYTIYSNTLYGIKYWTCDQTVQMKDGTTKVSGTHLTDADIPNIKVTQKTDLVLHITPPHVVQYVAAEHATMTGVTSETVMHQATPGRTAEVTYDNDYGYAGDYWVCDKTVSSSSTSTTYTAGTPMTLAQIADVSVEDDLVFTLYSKGGSTSVPISAKKVLQYGTLTTGAFRFGLYTNCASDKKTVSGLVGVLVTNAASGTITFPNMTISSSDLNQSNGQYTKTYYIKEQIGSASDIIYDDHVIPVKITVTGTRKSTSLTGTVQYQTAANWQAGNNTWTSTIQEFVNTKKLNTTAEIKAKKVLNGGNRVLVGNDFRFGLYSDAACTNKLQETTNDANGNIKFTRDFDQSDIGQTYTYYMKEIIPSPAVVGMTYATTVYQARVAVSLSNNALVCDVKYADQNGSNVNTTIRTFSNTYEKDGTATIQTKKVMQGRTLQNQEFSFGLYDDPSCTASHLLATTKNDANGNIQFTRSYTEYDIGDTFLYYIKEIIPSNPDASITYSTDVYTVKVVVDDSDTSATLPCSVSYADAGSTSYNSVVRIFTNTYTTPEPGRALINAKKVLNGQGKTLVGNDFAFGLYTDSACTNKIQEASNDAAGNIQFTMNYAQSDVRANPYTYYIKEIQPTASTGWTYSNAVYPVNVTVALVNNAVNCTVAYPNGTPTFINTFEPSPISVDIQARKVLSTQSGRTLQGNDFRFGLYSDAACTNKLAETGNGNASTNGLITFTQTYTGNDVGEHIYYMKEIIPSMQESGMTYSTDIYKVKVFISLVGDNLQKTVTYADRNSSSFDTTIRQFVNTFAPADKTVTITANKVLNGGKRTMTGNDFQFGLYSSATSTTPIATAQNNAAGQVTFTRQFTAADIRTEPYVYYIKEIVPAQSDPTWVNGMTYSQASYRVQVRVELVNNELTCTVSYPDGSPSFINTYNKAGSAELTAKKILNAGGRTLAGNDFQFGLYADPSCTGAVLSTARNDVNGNIKFTMNYNETDLGETYTYYIKEIPPASSSKWTYSTTIYPVQVSITDNNDKATLDCSVTYPNGSPQFINTYQINGQATIQAKKVLTGKDLAGNDFNFGLYSNAACTDASLIATATNNASGNIQFTRSYNQNDIGQSYVYYMKEIVPASTDPTWIEDMTYSTAVYKVKVDVADNDAGTALNCTVTYANQNSESYDTTVRTFTNILEVNGAAEIKAKKVLIAGAKTLSGNDFRFGLYSDATCTDANRLDTAFNDANGDILFTRQFTQADVRTEPYIFYIKEIAPSPAVPNWTYSTSVYQARVTVSLVNNKLHTDVQYADQSGSNVNTTIRQFTNTFDPPAVSTKIKGKKILQSEGTGSDKRTLQANEFTFQLKAYNKDTSTAGDVIGTTKNDGNGDFEFSLNFDRSDIGKTYYYQMTEVPGTEDTQWMTYSNAVYYAKVVVGENASTGTIATNVTYTSGSAAGSYVTTVPQFTNISKAPPTVTAQILGTKALTGETRETPLQKDEFTFELHDYNPNTQAVGTLVATAKNEADGSITFNLTYGWDKIGKHEYIMSEVAGNDRTIEYSTATYPVTITVSNDQGQLKADVDVKGATMRFENKYKKPYEFYDLTVSKTVTGNMGDKSKEWTFTITATNNTVDLNTVATQASERLWYEYTNASGTVNNGLVRIVNNAVQFQPDGTTTWLPNMKLTHNETLKVHNIPQDSNFNTSYSVSEVEANTHGYTTTTSGDAVSGVLRKHINTTFTNRRQAAVPTKVRMLTGAGVGFMILMLAGSTFAIFRLRRRKRNER